MTDGLSRETLAAQALGEIDQVSGALSPAINPSTIYERSPDGSYRSGLAYTRADNPTYDHAERLLAALEGGVACMLFASGSAAATAVFQSLLPGVRKGPRHQCRMICCACRSGSKRPRT